MSTDNLDTTSSASITVNEKNVNTPPNDKKNHNPRLGKKAVMLITTIVFLLVFIAYGIYWFMVLRFQQNTDDAYVAGIQVPIIAQTQGNVKEVFFEDTDLVHAGDIVVVLDNTDAKLAYDSAKSELANEVRKIQTLYQENIAYRAEIEAKSIQLAQAERDYQRRIPLGKNNVISKEELQHAKEAVKVAKASLEATIQKLKSNEAILLDTAPNQQPSILAAANKVKETWINLQRTAIRSPATGYVARRNVQVGAEVNQENTLMVIVPLEPMWVNANFKETQLKNIRIGQPVTITSEIYGDKVIYDGTITGLDMGTGSAFSLLPAQNATGNWIKIVQRLPVRVDLNPQQIKQKPLRIGLSMNATVDIRDTSGPVLEIKKRQEPAFKSNVLVLDLAPIEKIIEEIIQANTFTSSK